MKKVLWIIGFGFSIASLIGCAPIKSIIPLKTGIDIAGAVSPFPSYSGFKARISVADFDVKAAKATSEIGSDLRGMLTTALIDSNRFSIVERKETAQSDSSEPQKDEIKIADLIVSVAVIEFNPQTSGGREGLGGGGGIGSGILGGLLGASLNKALIALDIRIVDTSTSAVLVANRIQGQASDIAGISSGGVFGKWDLGKALSAYANTPMEKAIRICIIEAVRYVSQSTPANYYKY